MRPKTLTNTNTKKFSEESEIAYQTQKHHPPTGGAAHFCVRYSQPLSTNQTPHPTTKAGQQQPPPNTSGAPPPQGRHPSPVSHTQDEEMTGLLSQSPIVCLAIPSPMFPHRLTVCRAPDPDPLQIEAIHRFACGRGDPRDAGRPQVSWCSLERR
jgi:hypothetical protein